MLETSQRMHINHVEPVLSEAVRGCRHIYEHLNKIIKNTTKKSAVHQTGDPKNTIYDPIHMFSY